MSGVLRRLLDARAARQDDQVGERDLLAAGCGLVERLLDALERFSTFASSAGWLTSQSFCGASRMRAPFAPPRLSEPRNVDAEAHAVETSCETEGPKPGSWPSARRRPARRPAGDRPRESGPARSALRRNLWAEVARTRTHVAVGELEPCVGEGVGELVGMLEEAPRDLLVDRIEAQ